MTAMPFSGLCHEAPKIKAARGNRYSPIGWASHPQHLIARMPPAQIVMGPNNPAPDDCESW